MIPKVSIVLPTYNGETYLAESLDSVLGQTFQDWELIVVDDCSTDRTPQIINEYITKDSRIRVIRNEENQKLPKSLNIGFAVAKGEYFTWTSDDNIYHKKAIEVMASALDVECDVPMVYAGMTYIDEQNNVISKMKQYSDDQLLVDNIVGACFMYRKSVYESIGGYNADMFLVEDYDYWLRIKEGFGKIKLIPDYLYLYRLHGNSLTELRKKTIKEQLEKLKKIHIPSLLSRYGTNKSLLCQIYYDWLGRGYNMTDMQETFFRYVPELKYEKLPLTNREIAIFGAGEIGKRALDYLGTRGILFIDNDVNKVGKYINGVKIVSLAEFLSMKADAQILIAVSEAYVCEIMTQLLIQEISDYCTFQYMVSNMEK